MKTRKKKEKQRALHRKTKELVKTAPRFLTRDKETYFNCEMEKQRALHRKTKELVKTDPRFLTRDKETFFNCEMDQIYLERFLADKKNSGKMVDKKNSGKMID